MGNLFSDSLTFQNHTIQLCSPIFVSSPLPVSFLHREHGMHHTRLCLSGVRIGNEIYCFGKSCDVFEVPVKRNHNPRWVRAVHQIAKNSLSSICTWKVLAPETKERKASTPDKISDHSANSAQKALFKNPLPCATIQKFCPQAPPLLSYTIPAPQNIKYIPHRHQASHKYRHPFFWHYRVWNFVL